MHASARETLCLWSQSCLPGDMLLPAGRLAAAEHSQVALHCSRICSCSIRSEALCGLSTAYVSTRAFKQHAGLFYLLTAGRLAQQHSSQNNHERSCRVCIYRAQGVLKCCILTSAGVGGPSQHPRGVSRPLADMARVSTQLWHRSHAQQKCTASHRARLAPNITANFPTASLAAART